MINKQNTIENALKQNRGITLIALVITIIVLLILAGITIATLTGDNGLLTKTSEAQFRTEIAQYKEELNLSIINDQAGTKGNRTTKFNETEYSKIKQLIPSFNKKYENSLVIEEDKLVYKGNDKTLYRKAVEIGLISEDELLDDELLEELQPFITEWTVEAGDTITLPIGGTCDFTVNYGDGTEELKVTSSTDEDRIHTYTTAGTYNISIKGKCTSIIANNESKAKMSKVLQWGNTEFTNINFGGSTGLKEISNPSKNSFKQLTSINFINCSNLSCEIPEKLFWDAPKLGSCYNLFVGCTNLSGNIPKDMFKGAQNVSNVQYLFSNCKKLSGPIPSELFKKLTKVNSFNYVFNNCQSLDGNIPENLFKENINVTSFYQTFSNCSGLTGKIPENLFTNNINASDFQMTFMGCIGLIGEIPENLFTNNTKAKNMWKMFYGCNGLTGIPGNLFVNNIELENLSEAFYGCKGIKSIPSNLLKNNTELKTVASIFNQCTGLKGNISKDLFINNSKITNFSNAFRNCNQLRGNAPDYWNQFTNVSSWGCFYECHFENQNDIPSSWK